jgi:ABC-type dipeptide/oligopeptide/nickel transport system permease component
MLAFITRRLLLAIPTLLGVVIVTFLLLFVAPGDPVLQMVGERADPETIARLRSELHLDDPLPAQFGHYIAQVVRGDLGRSYITNRPISQDLVERFPKTLELAGAAMLLAAVIGITVGVLTARFPNGWFDRLALAGTYVGISFPVYWVGLLLILIFAVMLRWLPPSGYGGLSFSYSQHSRSAHVRLRFSRA